MCVPEPRGPILGSGRDRVTLGGPRTRQDGFGMALEGGEFACALTEVPDRRLPVVTARNDMPAIWGECQ